MLKNIFKSAKNLLKSPIGQIGVGLLAPGFNVNPAVAQGIAALVGGDKPANIAKNLGITALLGGVTSGPNKSFMEGAIDTFRNPAKGPLKYDGNAGFGGNAVKGTETNIVQDIIDKATGGVSNLLKDATLEDYIGLATLGLGIAGAKDDPFLKDVNPQNIPGINQDEYRKMLADSKFQATGGIAGMATGGEKMTSIGINGNTGEPSGLVTGPGTGTSDSIRFVSSKAKVPTDISNGEFIITKEATDKIGPENLYALQTAFDKDAETFEEGQERMAMV